MNASNMSMDSMNQKAEFWALLKDALPAMQVFNPKEAAGGWWLALKGFTFEQSQTAITRLLKLGKKAPVPADVIAIIQEDLEYLWISADEAWALVLIMSDEERSTFTSDAIDLALQNLNELIAIDQIAGRMAFKSAYERVRKTWMAQGRVPTVRFAQGTNKAERADVIKTAVAQGLISNQQAQHFLPTPDVAPSNLLRIAQDKADKVDGPSEALQELKKMFGIGEHASKPKWNVADRVFEQDGITMVEIDGVVKKLSDLDDRF